MSLFDKFRVLCSLLDLSMTSRVPEYYTEIYFIMKFPITRRRASMEFSNKLKWLVGKDVHPNICNLVSSNDPSNVTMGIEILYNILIENNIVKDD